MPLAIVAGVVAAGAAAGSAVAKHNAAKKAAGAQKGALAKQQDIKVQGPGSEVEKAKAQDIQHYVDSYNEFAKLNPELAAAKTAAATNLKNAMIEGPARSEGLLNQAITEGTAKMPEVSLADQIVATAKRNLDLGATLPAEFQAELVRTGLESSGMTGVSANRGGAVTQRLGTLIGSAGLALQSQRQSQAETAVQMATQLRSQRQNILQGLVDTSQRVRLGEIAASGNVVQGIDRMTPSIGMSGADVVKMDLANLSAQNKRAIDLGNIKAGEAMSKGEYVSGLLAALQSGATTAAGLYKPATPDTPNSTSAYPKGSEMGKMLGGFV